MKYPINPVNSSFSSKITTFQFIHFHEYREHHSYRVQVNKIKSYLRKKYFKFKEKSIEIISNKNYCVFLFPFRTEIKNQSYNDNTILII